MLGSVQGTRSGVVALIVLLAGANACTVPSSARRGTWASTPNEAVMDPPPPAPTVPTGPHHNQPILPPAMQTGPTVADVVDLGCVTTVVDGLSRQIIEELRCLEPSAFVELPPQPNLELGPAVFPYLESSARQGLLEALQNAQRSHPNLRLVVNSMYRSAAQQYLLRRWSKAGQCNIAIAAAPGRSRHETGLSLDIQQYDAWRPILEASRFKWFGAADPVHFDYVGTPDAPPPDLRGLDVRAFQRLWNRNFPDDPVAEDGDFGEETERRMERSPSRGFTRGADCAALN